MGFACNISLQFIDMGRYGAFLWAIPKSPGVSIVKYLHTLGNCPRGVNHGDSTDYVIGKWGGTGWNTNWLVQWLVQWFL